MRLRLLHRRLVGLLLVALLLPGWNELLESVGHLLNDGHMPHSTQHELASGDETHRDHTDEHGCTAMAHNCGCHFSAPGVLDDPNAAPASIFAALDASVHAHEGTHPTSWANAPPTRPPIV